MPSIIEGWSSRRPAWTAGDGSNNPSLGNGTLLQRWKRVDDQLFIIQKLVIGSTTTLGTGTWQFDLPERVNNKEMAYFPLSAVAVRSSTIVYPGTALVTYPFEPLAMVVYFAGGIANPTTPLAWAAGDVLYIGNAIESFAT